MHDNEGNDEIGYDTEVMEREKMTLCVKDTNLTHRRRFIYIFLRHVTHYVGLYSYRRAESQNRCAIRI